MSYEEGLRFCLRCRRETWHGRDAPDPLRARSLAWYSHILTLATDLCIPWRCLDCGLRQRGRPAPPTPP